MVELQLNRNFLTESQKGVVLKDEQKDSNKSS